MPASDGFEIEYDEAWGSGSVLLRVGDDVVAGARAGLMLGAVAYGEGPLLGAADRFAARFTHAMWGIGDDVIASGEKIRATVTSSRDADILAPALLPGGASEHVA